MWERRTSLATVAALLVLVAIGPAAGKPGGSTQDPATVTFLDRPGDRMLSVGGPFYDDAEPCVIAWVDSSSGQFFFRTAGRPGGLPCARGMRLDFGDALQRQAGCNCSLGPCDVNDAFNQVGTLNICGTNPVGDVRWIAGNLFGSSALSSGIPLTLRINLTPNFQVTAFELQFEQSLPVTGDDTTRTMSADASPVAELYQYTGNGNKKVSLGRFHMPFALEVMR